MPAVKTLAQEAEVSEDALADEASHLADFLAAPKHIPGPTSDVESPNAVHQADLLFLPHDRLPKGKKVYKYALTVVDVASRFKAAQPLMSKDFSEVSKAFQTIYKCGPLRWPKIVQFDPGREFMVGVTREMAQRDVRTRRGNVNVHRDQGIIKRFNRTLGERPLTFQYSQEMNFKEVKISTEWVKKLPEVVLALNSEKTRLTGKKPVDAIQEKVVDTKNAAGEMKGGQRRASDPIWSLKV